MWKQWKRGRRRFGELRRLGIGVDLAAQTVALPDSTTERFDIDPFRKECLLNGWDEIDLTLQHESAIAAYEARQRAETPWLAKP